MNPYRNSWHSLTDEERRLIVLKFGPKASDVTKRLGVGYETYKTIMSPGGTVSRTTIDRIRSILENSDGKIVEEE